MLVISLFAAIIILACAAAAGLIAITCESPEDGERLSDGLDQLNTTADTSAP